uniref:Uncharacterized protein n=1 Tax=Arundo donax TaxID=35708 RepID=A0A0A9GLU8_ARUDO
MEDIEEAVADLILTFAMQATLLWSLSM